MLELDFSEQTLDEGQGHSQENRMFLKIASLGIRHTGDSHYKIPLPFRRDDVRFPENKEQVLQRARSSHKIKVKVKSAYEPSGPPGRSLSQFLWHEATRSVSTPPWTGC